MSFIDPNADPTGVGGLVAQNTTALPPIVKNLPNAQKAYAKRYTPQQVQVLHSYFDKNVVGSFLEYEKSRVAKGQYPLSSEDALKVMAAAQKGRASTPAPDRSALDILGNAASDVGDIVTGIPKMPEQIAADVMDLPNIGKRIHDAGGGVGGLLSAPVVRLIPGAYTAKNIATGDLHEAITHPVMTALDVLPYAKELHVGERIGNLDVPGTTNLESGGRNTISDYTDRVKGVAERSNIGQAAKNAFGGDTRGLSRILGENVHELGARMNPAMAFAFDDNLTHVATESIDLANRAQKSFDSPERAAQVFHAMETDNLSSVNLSDKELAGVQMARDAATMQSRFNIDAGNILERNLNGTTEQLLPAQAKKIDAARSKYTVHTTMTNLRESVVNGAADPDVLAQHVQDALATEPKLKVQRDILSGYVHALDRSGYDTGTWLSDISRARKADIPSVADIRGTIEQPTEGAVRTRRRTGNPALESADRWMERNRDYTTKANARLAERTQGIEQKVVPARWQPLMQDMRVDRAKSFIDQTFAADDPVHAQLMSDVHQHIYNSMPEGEMARIDGEIRAAIPELRAQGVDPQFFHHVSPDAARSMNNPTITTMVPTPTQLRARINDWTPHVDSFSVSLTHGALELLRQDQTIKALDGVREAYTQTVAQREAELGPIARRAAERNGTSYQQEFEKLLRKTTVKWDATERGFFPDRAKAPVANDAIFNPDDLVIDKHLAHALQQAMKPPPYSRLLDPVTKAFRYSVLPFSPRFHLNNIVGGTIMEALEDPRALAKLPEGMKFSRDVYNMSKAMARGESYELADTTKAIIESMPKEMRAQIGSLRYGVDAEGLYSTRLGGQLGKWAQDSGVARMAETGIDKFKAAADWSMNVNQLWDDAYRTSAYLSDFDKGIKKGMSPEEAGAVGYALANKIMPRWLEMTPIERSVFRAVFPFYSFMSHVFRYAMRYPMDHPWRTSVMGGLARAELDDLGTGLPQMLGALFPFGGVDASGNQSMIDIGASNPFRDLGDQLTVAGFLGQTNPVFKGALRSIGYDPDVRGPNLYPDVTYDPKTGQFKSAPVGATSLLGGFAKDVIPQTAIVGELLGTSSEFKSLLRTNPGAATRMLLSQAGIPNVYKKVPVYADIYKAEVNRQQSQTDTWNAALKSGDYSRAWDYPELRPQIRALLALQKSGAFSGGGALAQYIAGAPNTYLEGVANASAAPSPSGSQSKTQAEVRVSQ
jgi:hypothetical protein